MTGTEALDPELIKFLQRVPSARWRYVPKGWSEQFRAALSNRLVKVGWGGIIELTAPALDLLLHLPADQPVLTDGLPEHDT